MARRTAYSGAFQSNSKRLATRSISIIRSRRSISFSASYFVR
jgi:hypothetical protein